MTLKLRDIKLTHILLCLSIAIAFGTIFDRCTTVARIETKVTMMEGDLATTKASVIAIYNLLIEGRAGPIMHPADRTHDTVEGGSE